MTATIPAPNSSRSRKRGGVNLEKWGWIYMRASGVLLLILVFGHLFANLIAPSHGVHAIDFGFVAGKWATPFWRVWDGLLLWLALIHGANGMRTIVNDYSRGRMRPVLLGAIAVSTIVLILLGTLVITTFDPCLDPSISSSIAQCTAK